MTVPTPTTTDVDILHYMFFPGGGIGRYLNEIIQFQVEQGEFEIGLVCSPNFEYLQDVPCAAFPTLMTLGSKNPLVRRARFLLAQWMSPWRLCRLVEQLRPKIVHFSNINYLSYASWRGKLQRLGVKMVATAHDVRRAKALIYRPYEERMLKQFYRDCAALFVHSQEQVDDLIEFAQVEEKRVHIVPHGPYEYPAATAKKETLRAKYDISQQRRVGLFFGYIRDDKNLENLLRGLVLCSERPYLFIAGRGGGKGNKSVNWYRSLAAQLGIETDVKFMDRYIADAEVGDLYEIADFSALTYSESFSSQSGVLNVSAHYRKPVLVTPSPTLAATVRLSGIGVVTTSSEAESIAEGIQSLLPKLNQDWDSIFDQYLVDFGWRENVERTAMVYQKVIDG